MTTSETGQGVTAEMTTMTSLTNLQETLCIVTSDTCDKIRHLSQ